MEEIEQMILILILLKKRDFENLVLFMLYRIWVSVIWFDLKIIFQWRPLIWISLMSSAMGRIEISILVNFLAILEPFKNTLQPYISEFWRKTAVNGTMKWKTKRITLSEQFQHPNEKSEKQRQNVYP